MLNIIFVMLARVMPRILAVVAILLVFFNSTQAYEGCTRSPCPEIVTEADCLNLGGYWYDGICNEYPPPPPPPTTTSSYYSSSSTSTSGASGSSFSSFFGDSNPEPVCSPDTLAGCTNEADCQANGGEWQEKQGCPQSPCPSYECIPKQCDRYHLNLCNSEETCESLGYGYWYYGSCHSRPKPVCSPTNLAECQNQEDCLENGGEWHNSIFTNVVRCLPVSSSSKICELPLNNYLLNYISVTHPVKSAVPEDCKPFASGDLSSGSLSLQIGLPAFSSGVDVYLAIGFADMLFLIDSDNAARDASRLDILPCWKTNVLNEINTSLYGNIPTFLLPTGSYSLYVAVVPTGEPDFSHYYLWSTNFSINH